MAAGLAAIIIGAAVIIGAANEAPGKAAILNGKLMAGGATAI